MDEEDPELSREELLQRYGRQGPRAPGSERRSPFKFLDSYDLGDADIFFGRDTEIEELLGHFRSYGHVLIYGESGSGKSSLVHCGLRSQIPEADALFIPLRVHTTGLPTVCHQICESASQQLGEAVEESPEAGLVETLRAAHQAASRPIVLFFDQFEELFIFHDSAVRRQFAEELASIRTARLNVKVLIGVRQDFLGHLSELEDTVEGLFDNRFWLRRMSRENAAEAVVKACATCEVTIDDELAQTILHRLDPGGQGVELPYLQVVMDRLYRQAVEANPTDPVITSGDVQQLGDITDILGTFLVEEVAKLPSPDTGRQILKAFVTGEGTRRTLDRAAVGQEAAGFGEAIPEDALDAHLNQLASVRILREIADTDSYELRHDALAATVAGWISEVEKELIEVRDNLVNRFREYEARDRDSGALLDQGFLGYLAVYRERLRPLLDDALRQYLEDSERHVGQAARVRRRVRQTVAGVVGSIILALFGFAGWQGRKATRQLNLNHIQEGRAWVERADRFLLQPDRFAAALMAARAIGFAGYGRENMGHDFQAGHIDFLKAEAAGEQRSRAQAILKESVILPIWQSPLYRHHDGPIEVVAFIDDGKTLASGSSGDGIFKLWNSNPESGKLAGTIGAPFANASSVAISSDGKTLATGNDKGVLSLWNGETGEPIRQIRAGAVDETVSSLAFDRDVEVFASGSSNGNIKIWEVSKVTEKILLKGDETNYEPVQSLAFSPDGERLAAGTGEGGLTLWNVEEKESIVSESAAHNGAVHCVAFDRTGQTLASGGEDGALGLWDGKTGEAKSRLVGHASAVRCVSFAPDGKVLASGSSNGTIKLWNAEIETGEATATFRGRQAGVRSVSFSPDGKTLVSGGETGLLQLWDVTNVKEIEEISPRPGAQGSVTSVAISYDGKFVASGAKNGTLKLWDVAKGKELPVFDGHKDAVSNVAFSPDGAILASTSADGAIKLWKVEDGEEIPSPPPPLSTSSASIAFGPDGKLLACGSSDNKTIDVWEVESGNILHTIASDESVVSSVALSPGGKLLALAFPDKILVRKTESEEILDTIPGQGGVGVSSIAFSPDSELIAVGNHDGDIGLWARDLRTKDESGKEIPYPRTAGLLTDITEKPIGFLSAHRATVHSLAFSSDGKTLVSGSEDGTVKFWRVHTGLEKLSPDSRGDQIYSAASGPGGFFATGATNGTIRLWKSETGDEIGSWKDEYLATCLAFAANKKRLAWGSLDDKTISFWDWQESGEPVKLYPGSPQFAYCVALSADGNYLASGHSENEKKKGVIRLWNVETKEVIISIEEAHGGSVKSLAFQPSSNGKQIFASGGNDGLVKLWELHPAEKTIVEIGQPTGHEGQVWCVAFSPDGKTLASGSMDLSIKLWNARSGKEIRTLSGFQSAVASLAFSPDGRLLASGSERGNLRLWDVKSGEDVHSHFAHSDKIVGLGFSRDGKTLESAGYSAIKIWDVEFLIKNGRPDLAAYLSEKWLELTETEIRWRTTTDKLFAQPDVFKSVNYSWFSDLGKFLRGDPKASPK